LFQSVRTGQWWLEVAIIAPRHHEGAIVRKNGKLFGSACGVEALGNPLSVVSWLANELAKHDRQIDAGHVVSTGSLTSVCPAVAGDVIEMSFANLGAIRFAIVE